MLWWFKAVIDALTKVQRDEMVTLCAESHSMSLDQCVINSFSNSGTNATSMVALFHITVQILMASFVTNDWRALPFHVLFFKSLAV